MNRHTFRIMTEPTLCEDMRYCHMSYALYRIGTGLGEILASRSPVRSLLRPGDYLQDVLELSPEAVAFMADRYTPHRLMFVISNMGLGLICKTYEATAGMGIYYHFHCRPRSGAKLIKAGLFGRIPTDFLCSERVMTVRGELTVQDESSYPALLNARRALDFIRDGMLALCGGTRLHVQVLESVITAMAGFVGCEVSFATPCHVSRTPYAVKQVICCQPAMLEAFLLYYLTEARSRSEQGSLVCTIGSVGGVEGTMMEMSLWYPLRDPNPSPAEVEQLARREQFFGAISRDGGLLAERRIEWRYVKDGRARATRRPGQLTTLVWMSDPANPAYFDVKSAVEELWHSSIPITPTADDVYPEDDRFDGDGIEGGGVGEITLADLLAELAAEP